jgi:mRNA interferase RelE/StbE
VQIKYEARFEKDLKIIQDTNLLKRIKKLKGHDSFYRIKIGDYRIGFEMVNEELILTRILHRKTIYRYFP